METLVKRNSLLPLLPTSNFIDDLFSRDIFDWTNRNSSSIGSNLPSVNLKETEAFGLLFSILYSVLELNYCFASISSSH